ncbi:hypothetical protein [Actibacterium sp. 188UL27-1]|uniref:hypothetical protein n=1 Tax=Actibacterium sp. 188UL27-1 TaxID=2786961 RepID=UPI00195EEB21|nr:hypothetical protein [Actibacterium sp. 188UL27-1]MBM7069591.1 hypothetical protein [Actibacterium sp. 188UL27-1]
MSQNAVGGAVDLFAGLAQKLMNKSVMHRARLYFRKYWKDKIIQEFSRNNATGVLLVIGVGEPKAWMLDEVPRQRIFLGLHVAGYGSDPKAVRRAYLAKPRGWIAVPQNSKSMMRMDYYVWMRPADVYLW